MGEPDREGDFAGWVYREVRARIFDGRLAAGDVLRERELSADLDVSRVPIREALPALEAAGLVVLTPRKPAVVTAITRSAVEELYDIRGVLEPLAAAKAAASVRAGAEADLLERALASADAALADGDLPAFHDGSGAVHHEIESLAANGLFTTVMNPLRERSNRLNVSNISALPQVRHTEHVLLVRAIVRGDVDVARAVAFTHVEFGRTRVLETLSSLPDFDPFH